MAPNRKRTTLYSFTGERYTLGIADDAPFAYLGDVAGRPLAELFLLSSIHPLHGRDDTVALGAWEVEERDDETIFSLRVRSSVWNEKRYYLRCQPQRFLYEMEVVGQGRLAEVHPFGGYCSARLRAGSGFFLSGHFFRQGFNPEPNRDKDIYFPPEENASINLTGVPLPGRANWFFTPPPFCFAFEGAEEWVSMGVEARPGENRWTDYLYTGHRDGFHLTLHYEGYTEVEGAYRLPAIAFDFGPDAYTALAAHADALRAAGHAPTVTRDKPAWWYEPIFCGWGSQCHLATQDGGDARDYAQQHLYDQFLDSLARNQIAPGIVVLDDKWQVTYGGNEVDEAKWPDLRAFVDSQHAAGRKVLLWLKAWDPEGVPPEECITNAAGLPIAVDPTNPAYERRFRAAIRRMLSPAGYDADGFKIDFSARIPTGPGMNRYGDEWGLELMKRYFYIIYDEAKRSKPDTLVMTHTPHPYLADVVDIIRLNDMIKEKDIPAEMRHRAKVAAIACPDALIDTDNWPATDRENWRRYLRLQAEIGVPSLYYSSHVDETGEPLEEEDYQLIRDVWATYRNSEGRGR